MSEMAPLKGYISRRENMGLCELAKEEGGKEFLLTKKWIYGTLNLDRIL